MKQYNHIEIEKKWQKYWDDNKTFQTDTYSDKEKFYALDMFPYPSGAGLHVGHPEGYTATDIVSRMKRMQGYEVLHPIGWDAFGLPAEQYAIQHNEHPGEFTKNNIANFKSQTQALGFSYDWDREFATTDKDYYKWTQWIFTKIYEKGLAELKDLPVNYCPECGTVLANEEVVDGRCERKGHIVVKKNMKQWELKITEYAERLLEDLDLLEWPHALKEMQRNWIGKSVGANVKFPVQNKDLILEVYTTRPDTLFGVTALFIAPEHPLLPELVCEGQENDVNSIIEESKLKSELERTELNKDKKGAFTGSYVLNPATNQPIPVWVADFVIVSYATGMVMSTPAHDERDFEFATKYDLPIKYVLECEDHTSAFTGDSPHINSEFLNGLYNKDAIDKMVGFLEDNGFGNKKVNYKIRDWLFSRQRYWGEPFPIIHLEDGRTIVDTNLPVELPNLKDYKPSADGKSPLANDKDFVEVEVDGVKGYRETNTMPQWAGSCWYYLRFIDPHNDEAIASKELLDKWLPVDLYIGGAEHAVLHLLYARFWHKILYDLDIVSTKEPFYRLFNQGMILGEGNEKMSKSKGNVVNPDDIVESHGADTLRLYEMFMGPLDASIAWSADGLDGSKKFIDRVVRLYDESEIVEDNKELDKVYNETVKKVTNDFEILHFNTAISQLMIFVNSASKIKKMSKEQAEGFLKLLNPVCPHITEELYSELGNKESITYSNWPTYDESKLVSDQITIVVQVNGKLRAKIQVNSNISKADQLDIAKEQVAEHLQGKEIKKEIVIEKKLVNFVI